MNPVSPAPVDIHQPASSRAAWRSTESPSGPVADVTDQHAEDHRRRLGERATIALDVTIYRGADLRLTRTLDVSSTGCALQACADPLRGRVTLQLVDSSGERLRVAAYFKRSFQGGDAYEFAELTDADRLNVAELIDAQRRAQH